jgi:hypothetical protein
MFKRKDDAGKKKKESEEEKKFDGPGDRQGGPYMGGGDSEESDGDGINRKMLPYNNKTRGLFMFFTELSQHRFFRKLVNYLREKDINSSISDQQWQLTFKVERELDDLEIE